jgi:hypothetical protein
MAVVSDGLAASIAVHGVPPYLEYDDCGEKVPMPAIGSWLFAKG